MEALLERCAGLDVHQASVVCCVLIGILGRRPQKLVRSFGTTTRELEALRAWLAEHGVTHVGMESTGGVYWKPVYAVLEGHFDLTVGNAHHIKAVPGRKTDWIAERGFDAWLVDVCGYGLSTRPPEMDRPAAENPPAVRTDVAGLWCTIPMMDAGR